MFRQKVPAVATASAAGATEAATAGSGCAVTVLSPLALRSTAALLALGVAGYLYGVAVVRRRAAARDLR